MYSKLFDLVMTVIKGILWISAAVVYTITLFVNGKGSGILEIAFCFGVIFLGIVLGFLNIRKIPRQFREFKELKAQRAAAKAGKTSDAAQGETAPAAPKSTVGYKTAAKAPNKVKKQTKAGDWPDLDD